MIQKRNLHWFKLLFVWNGSVLPKLLPRLVMLFVLSIVVVYFKGTFFNHKIPLNPAPFTLFGIALALFLGFRNSASYDRFWEGRKLWGALLNTTRSLARQCVTLSGYQSPAKETDTFINYLIAFVYALKHHLRGTDAGSDMQKWLPDDLAQKLKSVKFKPMIILSEVAKWAKDARDKGNMDSILLAAFDGNFNELSNIVGGCERILSTPIPFTYKVMLHRTVYFYCLLLPFGFVDSLGWMTPIIVLFIAYTFVALEAIADEIEEPFGIESNDLALNGMSDMIRNTLLEISGKQIDMNPAPDLYIAD
ncbi:bestrophin family protein [Mucilaginibacter sp.]